MLRLEMFLCVLYETNHNITIKLKNIYKVYVYKAHRTVECVKACYHIRSNQY